MRTRVDSIIPEIENGDVVKLRGGEICIVINGMVLDFENKVWRGTTLDDTYTLDYLDVDGDLEFDIVKIKSCYGLYGDDYFCLQDECIDWDWKRE